MILVEQENTKEKYYKYSKSYDINAKVHLFVRFTYLTDQHKICIGITRFNDIPGGYRNSNLGGNIVHKMSAEIRCLSAKIC